MAYDSETHRLEDFTSSCKAMIVDGCQYLQIRVFEHRVIGKKTKVKFCTAIHHTEGVLNYVYTDFGDLLRRITWRNALLCVTY